MKQESVLETHVSITLHAKIERHNTHLKHCDPVKATPISFRYSDRQTRLYLLSLPSSNMSSSSGTSMSSGEQRRRAITAEAGDMASSSSEGDSDDFSLSHADKTMKILERVTVQDTHQELLDVESWLLASKTAREGECYWIKDSSEPTLRRSCILPNARAPYLLRMKSTVRKPRIQG